MRKWMLKTAIIPLALHKVTINAIDNQELALKMQPHATIEMLNCETLQSRIINQNSDVHQSLSDPLDRMGIQSPLIPEEENLSSLDELLASAEIVKNLK